MGALAACFPKTNPNPLAPAFLFPSELLTEAPPGYRDEYAYFTVVQALTAGQVIQTVMNTDAGGQCNFYWRSLGVFLYGGDGTVSCRFRDSEGHMMMESRVALTNGSPFGAQDALTPIVPAHRMIPTAQLTFDFEETGGAFGVTIVLYIHGFKRWNQSPAFDGRGGAFGSALNTQVGGL
jgi:hypothetical protein